MVLKLHASAHFKVPQSDPTVQFNLK